MITKKFDLNLFENHEELSLIASVQSVRFSFFFSEPIEITDY